MGKENKISGLLGYSVVRALTDDKDPELAAEILKEADRKKIKPVPGSPEGLLLDGGTRFDPRSGKGTLIRPGEEKI